MNASPAAWLVVVGAKKIFLQDGIAAIPRILEVLCEARFLEVHDVLSAARSRADEDHPPKDRRTVLRDLLGDHAAEGETEDVALRQTEPVEKSHDVRRPFRLSSQALRRSNARFPRCRRG